MKAKRAALLRERKKVIASMVREGPVICARCGGRADDLHEVLSRARGGSPADPANMVPLCRPCHAYITEHPVQAEAEGLSKRVGCDRRDA
jgi:5-methylcytosine-specific restriction endonuclease McrA